MTDYARLDPYRKSRFDQGVDAKIVIMGNTGVGKTSLLHRYAHNKFDPKNTTSTTGAFFVTKKVYVDGIKVRLQLWDTAGQERFRSMAPMYYRGANAALLLYDITSASSFDDVRGWLEELKKNCSEDLIIYIVGAKADLHRHRQITNDFARLSLHTWFPPPRPPSPPPPPPPSTFSYMRPRFISFPSVKATPPTTPSQNSSVSPSSGSDSYPSSQVSAIKRSNTSAMTRPRAKSGDLLLPRANSTSAASRRPLASPYDREFGYDGYGARGWLDFPTESNSTLGPEEREDEEVDDQEWGLEKGMELFEVSAKDDDGVQNLFNSLIKLIIERRDTIEQENELKKRDSVFLTDNTPAWAAQADAEEAREKARQAAGSSWSCCQT